MATQLKKGVNENPKLSFVAQKFIATNDAFAPDEVARRVFHRKLFVRQAKFRICDRDIRAIRPKAKLAAAFRAPVARHGISDSKVRWR